MKLKINKVNNSDTKIQDNIYSESRQSLEQIQCCCCNEKKRIKKKLSSRDPFMNGDIYMCKSCKLLFAHPLPRIEDDCTPGKGVKFENEILALKKRSFSGYMKELEQSGFDKPETFLDLGGGIGYYSKAASDMGMDVTLVELNKNSIKISKTDLGLKNVFNLNIEEFFYQKKEYKYDLILLRHVIEHVLDPPLIIRLISRSLSENGVLIIETPNNNSIGFYLKTRALYMFYNFYRAHYKKISFIRFLFSRLYAIRPPQHLHIFNKNNLKMLLEKNGLKVSKFATYPMGDAIHWPLKNKATLSLSWRFIKRKKYLKSFLVFIECILNPFRSLLRYTSFACGLSMYVQKK